MQNGARESRGVRHADADVDGIPNPRTLGVEDRVRRVDCDFVMGEVGAGSSGDFTSRELQPRSGATSMSRATSALTKPLPVK